MLGFKPDFRNKGHILCLGAHCDDIEIGCGGTLLELRRRYPEARIDWIVFSGDDLREAETRAAAQRLMGEPGGGFGIEVHRFRRSYFPSCFTKIKDCFEKLRARFEPDLIFTHFLHDRHQDHRTIAELSWNTFRNHAVLEYEIAKFEGDLAHPNVYVPLTAENVERKLETLMACFASQHSHAWFDAELFKGLMRLRGVECNAPERHAEAFHVRKLIL